MTAPVRWLWPAATIVLAVLGAGALTAAAVLPGTADDDTAAPAASPSAAAPRAEARPTEAPTGTATAAPLDPATTPIAELADPDWVARIAAAGDIPERALAAYAGAAIAVAAADPGCGIGWNTIAAIGEVESEHGTMQGATIGEDGVAAPTIIGVALDGRGVDAVADTDGGALDGDPVWDHAVGPMQFIPSSWALLGQDGDRDGVRDVNDIDDAALAAAVHLCDVGGDLTRSSNWIQAVNAYNSTVDYNHRVAEAANRYAALGSAA